MEGPWPPILRRRSRRSRCDASARDFFAARWGRDYDHRVELSPASLRPVLLLALGVALPFACAQGNGATTTDGTSEETAAASSGAGGAGGAASATASSAASGGGCPIGFGDCDGKPANGCETDLSKSLTDCGACGKLCGGANTNATCDKGSCTLTCDAGFADCDKSSTNGCEIQTSTNAENCGECGSVCPMNGGTPNCVKSQCGVSSCAPGLGDCDGVASNGCETSLSNNAASCGACGKTCTAPNATTACKGLACAITGCAMGFGDCDSTFGNGCEEALDTLANCGACGSICKLAHANQTCATGTCKVSSCLEPFVDCDMNDANGCEANITDDAENCGGWARFCSASKPNASPACSAGACSFACNASFGNCNNLWADGCEIDLSNDASHCGSCGVVCAAGKTCIAGVCGVVGACAADSYEPNDVQQAPAPPPMLASMKPLDPANDKWLLSANRSSTYTQASPTGATSTSSMRTSPTI